MYLSTATIALYARSRWPGRHYQELAKVLGVSPMTAKSYVLGTRRMPSRRLRALIEYERADMATRESLAAQLEYHARQEERRPRYRHGMWEARDRGDGIVRDAVWRFGWPRRAG